MIYMNKLDVEGIKRLGICFRTEGLMNKFAETVRTDLEQRIGKELCETLSKDQIKDFEQTPDCERLMWLNNNCLDHREVVIKYRKEIKKELLEKRSFIKGNIECLSWKGASVYELDEMVVRDLKALKKNGIDTIGELCYIDDNDLALVLGLHSAAEKESRVKEIRQIVEEYITDHGE